MRIIPDKENNLINAENSSFFSL